ncbi:ABC transporter substrate-binding protein [Bordetella petrii]|nr:ABC transporter substrate-binding protein [Bordetella petrii]
MATTNKEHLLDVYGRMLSIRLVELRLGRLFADGEVPGFIHLSVGQEAVAAAMGVVLRREDTVASTHRGHGHALAKGIDIEDFFLELMAREEGICKGRGGSMHVANMSIGMLGANAIVGASIPIALGSALAHQVKKTDALAVAFFGDGAMAEGVLHESLNLASLWRLPLLFVCENNGWAEFSPTHKQFVAPLDKLAAAFSVPHNKVDGNDVLQVIDAAHAAAEAIRAGQGPQVLECITHRWRGHYEGDPQKYRPSDEIEGLGEHDPVARFETVLEKKGVKKAQREQVLQSLQARVEKAVERARQGRAPDWQAARNDVYTQAEVC